jgi:WD40 repeat protein
MERLWERERAERSRLLRLRTLTALGGAAEIVRAHLERALGGLTEEQRDVAAASFNHLVTPSGSKIAHAPADLARYAGVGESELLPVLSTLAQQRILRAGGNGTAQYEIFHDVLAAPVLGWRGRHEAARAVERERVAARRRHRRLLVLVGAALVALLAMTAVAAYAVSQRNRAEDEAAQAAAAEARAEQNYEEALAEKKRADTTAEELRVQVKRADSNAAKYEREAKRANKLAASEKKQRQVADAATASAEESTAEAVAARKDAEREADRADGEAANADASAAAAKRDRDTARQSAAEERLQRQRAQAAEDSARIGELVAQSKAALLTEPIDSLRYALDAADKQDTARTAPAASSSSARVALADTNQLEDAVRDALLALRVRRILDGGGVLTSARFSPDDKLVATAARTGGARIFDAASGELRHRLPHPARINDTAFSPDGSLFATAGEDGRARLWNVRTGRLVQQLPHDGPVVSIAFTPDGRVITAGGSDDRALRAWQVGTPQPFWRVPHGGPLRRAILSPDGSLVLTLTRAAGDRFARLYSTADGRRVAQLEMGGSVLNAAFSPRGDLVATTGTRNAQLWRTSDWSASHLLPGNANLVAADFSDDGAYLVTAGLDSRGLVFSTATGDRANILGDHSQVMRAVVFAPGSTMMATASDDHFARLWPRWDSLSGVALIGHTEPVVSAVFSRDATRLLTASADGEARIWDTRAEERSQDFGSAGAAVTDIAVRGDGLVASATTNGTITLLRPGADPRTLVHGRGRVLRSWFSADGATLVSAGADGTIRTWRVADGQPLLTIDHRAPISCRQTALVQRGPCEGAAYHPGTARVVTVGEDGFARVWDIRTGRQLWARDVGDVALTTSGFDRTGELVAAGGTDGVTHVWRARSGGLVVRLPGHEGRVESLAFSPASKRLVTGGEDGIAQIWDVASPSERPLHTLDRHDALITTAGYSPDGMHVLTSDSEGDLRLWNAADGSHRWRLGGHVSVISNATFSPDSRWVVSSGPGAAGVFQVRTGRRIFFVSGHDDPYTDAEFTPDGSRMYTASQDGTVDVYTCSICGELPELRRLGRQRLAALKLAQRGS